MYMYMRARVNAKQHKGGVCKVHSNVREGILCIMSYGEKIVVYMCICVCMCVCLHIATCICG